MYKYFLTAISIIVSLSSFSQDDKKYLEGAVPEIDGKVRFERTITTKVPVTGDKLFQLMEEWAKQNYSSNDENLQNRVLLSNPENKDIACQGEKYLVFKSGALVLDRAKMNYQLILEIQDGKCDVTIRNIKFDYPDYKESEPAERLITDKIALNKNKDKLNRYYDKFRTHTIDTINSIFSSIDIYLNGRNSTGVLGQSQQPEVSQTVSIPSAPSNIVTPQPIMETKVEPQVQAPVEINLKEGAVATEMLGYRQISADKIPGNIIKLLSDATLITSGDGNNTNVMTASWGGLGRFWEKPVAFCFLNPTRYSVQTMDKGETYTISFYTEAYRDALQYCGTVSGRDTDKIKGSGLTPIKTPSGATAFAEAWMIFECKKIVAQPISPDAVMEKDLPDSWKKDGFHKIYIGEILNVWIK